MNRVFFNNKNNETAHDPTINGHTYLPINYTRYLVSD